MKIIEKYSAGKTGKLIERETYCAGKLIERETYCARKIIHREKHSEELIEWEIDRAGKIIQRTGESVGRETWEYREGKLFGRKKYNNVKELIEWETFYKGKSRREK